MVAFNHQSIGGIEILTGEHCEELFNLNYNYNLSSYWTNVGSGESNFSLEFESTWQVNTEQYHWYRVIGSNPKPPLPSKTPGSGPNSGCCDPGQGSTPTPTPSPSTTITPTPVPTENPLQDWQSQKCACSPGDNPVSPKLAKGDLADYYESSIDTSGGSKNLFTLIAAQNIKQVCEQMKDPNFGPSVNFRINSIKKNNQIIGSGSKEAGQFTEQEFCSCPECLEFCIDFDFANSNYQKFVKYEPIGFYMTVVVSVSTYDPGSVGESNGAITIGGSAQILRYWFPSGSLKTQLATESLIILSTESSTQLIIDYSSGIVISGSAEIVSSSFSYLSNGEVILTSAEIDYFINPLIRSASGFIIIQGSTSDIVAPNHQYNSVGGIQLGSSNIETSSYYFYDVSNCINQINIGGSATIDILTLNYDHEAEGSVVIFGSSQVQSSYYAYEPSSSLIQLFGNTNDIVSGHRSYTTQGQVNIFGSVNKIYRYYKSKGKIKILGSAYQVNKTNRFTCNGGLLIFSGMEDIISPRHTYRSQGTLQTTGTAGLNFTNLGTLPSYAEIYSVVFGSKIESQVNEVSTTTINTGLVSSCGCSLNSLTLSLNHNINNSGVLSEFLTRNNFNLDQKLKLRYKKITNSWSSSQHYKGKGLDGKSLENWYVNFELTCTDLIENQTYSNYYFKFNLFVRRQNLTNNFSDKTNLFVDIKSSDICVNKNVSTIIEFNSFNQKFFIDGIQNDSGKIFDEIGLFKNGYWNNKKNFSQVRAKTSTVPTITGLFPTFKINIVPSKIMPVIRIEEPQPINV